MKFLHAADIHLDSPLRGLERYEFAPAERIRGATRRALENLVGNAIEERVDFLLIAGDLYDGDWPDYNTGLFFSRQMAHLRDAGIPVFLIRGNHDADSRLTKELRLPENVRIFPTNEAGSHRMDDLGVAIHGRGFATAAITENFAATFPAAAPGFFNIGLLHTSATGFEGHESYAPCSLSDLEAKRYDYWALGHVHVRVELKRGDPWIVFPGNIQGRHARETGPKGATLVTVEHGCVTSIEHRPLDVVRWAQIVIDVSDCETFDDVLAGAQRALVEEGDRAGGRLLAARVILQGACNAHGRIAATPEQFLNQLRVLANELGQVWLEQVRIETSAPLRPAATSGSEESIFRLLNGTRHIWDSQSELAILSSELDPLRKKLPPELLDELRLNDPVRFRELLDEAEQLLLPRLLAAETPA
jgi:exonuclease SbcD